MVEILGKLYYIDIDGISRKCQTGGEVKNEDGTTTLEINLFKYEILKSCVERILNEYNGVDDEMGEFGDGDLSVSFKLAYNTLIKYEILIAEDEQE
jgi:hypothetical protein